MVSRSQKCLRTEDVYVNTLTSLESVAKEVGVSLTTVKRWARQYEWEAKREARGSRIDYALTAEVMLGMCERVMAKALARDAEKLAARGGQTDERG